MTSPRWQVSTEGGTEPLWAHNGRELFYVSGANELVAVQVTGDPTFAAGQQDVLFPLTDYMRSGNYALYDLSSNDQRFLMMDWGTQGSDGEIILIENWLEELRQRMGN